MKRTIIAASVLALGFAGGGVSLADPGDRGPGPNGHNTFGLCTAYAHNNENAKKAPPFKALEEEAKKEFPSSADPVAEYCSKYGQHPGGGKGGGGK